MGQLTESAALFGVCLLGSSLMLWLSGHATALGLEGYGGPLGALRLVVDLVPAVVLLPVGAVVVGVLALDAFGEEVDLPALDRGR